MRFGVKYNMRFGAISNSVCYCCWKSRNDSRHNGGPIEDLLKPLNTIVFCDVMRGFRGALNWSPRCRETSVSRTAICCLYMYTYIELYMYTLCIYYVYNYLRINWDIFSSWRIVYYMNMSTLYFHQLKICRWGKLSVIWMRVRYHK